MPHNTSSQHTSFSIFSHTAAAQQSEYDAQWGEHQKKYDYYLDQYEYHRHQAQSHKEWACYLSTMKQEDPARYKRNGYEEDRIQLHWELHHNLNQQAQYFQCVLREEARSMTSLEAKIRGERSVLQGNPYSRL